MVITPAKVLLFSYIRKRAEKKVYCRVVLGRVVKVKVKVKRAKIGVF